MPINASQLRLPPVPYMPHMPPVPPVQHLAPWTLRAWPPLLWQPGVAPPLPFMHLATRVAQSGRRPRDCAGQTFWSAQVDHGEAGMAWDWVQIAHGVVALADPMSVVTNVQLIGREGGVLTAHEAACYLNQLVRALPWQSEVQRALADELN